MGSFLLFLWEILRTLFLTGSNTVFKPKDSLWTQSLDLWLKAMVWTDICSCFFCTASHESLRQFNDCTSVMWPLPPASSSKSLFTSSGGSISPALILLMFLPVMVLMSSSVRLKTFFEDTFSMRSSCWRWPPASRRPSLSCPRPSAHRSRRSRIWRSYCRSWRGKDKLLQEFHVLD